MKVKFFFSIVFVAVVALLSSCTKEVVTMSDSQRIDLIRLDLSSRPDYIPSKEVVLDLYEEKSGGLKDGWITEPEVGFSTPKNDIISSLAGGFKNVWVWSIIISDYMIERGMLVVYYDSNSQQTGDYEFFIGWENDYCFPVTFSSNVESVIQTNITFTYPTTEGRFGFETYFTQEGTEKKEMYLPLLNFACSWELFQNSYTVFGGTIGFNPVEKSEVKFIAGHGLDVNTNDCIQFDTPMDVTENCKIIMYIWDENENSVRKSIVYPEGRTLPEFVLIPFTFKPIKVSYQIIRYENGMMQNGDFIEKICSLATTSPSGKRTYVLR